MELFASQNPRAYSLYFDLKIWFRARNVTGAFEKRAPGSTVARFTRENKANSLPENEVNLCDREI